MCFLSDITAVKDYEMHYMNYWLKRCVFNLDVNRESVCLNHRRYQEGYSRGLEPNMKKFYLLCGLSYPSTTKSPEFCDLIKRVGL